MVVADLGCGIGGPMQEIARFSGAKIVGINSSAYQVRRAAQLSQASGLGHLLEFLECDFIDIDAPDASYEAVCSIQSICCAPDKAPSMREPGLDSTLHSPTAFPNRIEGGSPR